MITSKDRMGGFISAKIIDVKEIQSFQLVGNKVSLVYKDAYLPTSLDIVKNGAHAQVSSSMLRSGELFNIDIEIELKNNEKFNYKSFNKYLAVLKDAIGVYHVFGTHQFPLTLISNPKFGRIPSDRTNRIIKLSGNQPHDTLIL